MESFHLLVFMFALLFTQVTASSWLNDLRDQIQNTRFLNVVYRSASALGSHLPSISSAKARVAGAGALLRPVSTSTQVKSSYTNRCNPGFNWNASTGNKHDTTEANYFIIVSELNKFLITLLALYLYLSQYIVPLLFCAEEAASIILIFYIGFCLSIKYEEHWIWNQWQ